MIESIKARKGDNFRIPGHDETTYKVIDIQEDSALIAPSRRTARPEKESSCSSRG